MNRQRYDLLYVDPPWRFTTYSDAGRDRSPDKHYRTTILEQLASLPLGFLAKPNALMAMWVYDPMFPHALALAEAWGFDYSTVLFRWIKTPEGHAPGQPGLHHIGLGYHTRAGGCEECWLFKRGHGLPRIDRGVRREFFHPAGPHSEKPPTVRAMLEALYAPQRALEAFSRRPGGGCWEVWGDQAPGSITL